MRCVFQALEGFRLEIQSAQGSKFGARLASDQAAIHKPRIVSEW